MLPKRLTPFVHHLSENQSARVIRMIMWMYAFEVRDYLINAFEIYPFIALDAYVHKTILT